MRHLGWLSVVLLALSCSVDNSNLDVDAGGSGGIVGGSGGAGGAGGCPRCVNTGGAGGAQSGAGGQATGGTTGAGGQATGGQIGTGGSALGGQPGSGGSAAGAGGSGTGGDATGSGGSGTGGKGTGGKGAGGTTGTGGKGSGGATGTGGQGGAASCDMLATVYTTELTAAKSCSPGAANQCQQLVDSSLPCPGCKTYVNDTTNLDAIASQWTAAGCASMQHICPLIACVVPTPATCQAVATTGGGGPGPSGPAATTGMCK